MCGIVLSKSNAVFNELMAANSNRGTINWSLMCITASGTHIQQFKGLFSEIELGDFEVTIGHVQSPTSGSNVENRYHPCTANNVYMFHNGILKSSFMRKEGAKGEWDTKVLLQHYLNKTLDNVEGSFACIVVDNNKIFVFRNELCPLFIDNSYNISSVKYNDTYKPVSANTVFEYTPSGLMPLYSINNTTNKFFKG